jgi:hypothetical protein
VTTYATGLTSPRGLAFGPDGNLYVAEAGVGGEQTPGDIDPDCPVYVNIYSPFTAGYSGRVTRVLADGTTETVADNLPSITDVTGASLGPTDVAFVGGTLYVLIEMGGCSHAMPDDLPAILRVTPTGRRPASPTSTRGTRRTRRTSSRTPIRRPPTRNRAACSIR